VRLWDLSSKILRLKRRPPEHWRGCKPGSMSPRSAKPFMPQSFAAGGWHDSKGETCEAERLTRPKSMNIRLGYRLLRDHRVPIRAKLMALGIGAACIGALELLQLPLEAVLAGILPLIGITGDIAFDGAEAVVGPVIIATMLLPYLVAPPLVRQIRAEGERARGLYRQDCFSAAPSSGRKGAPSRSPAWPPTVKVIVDPTFAA